MIPIIDSWFGIATKTITVTQLYPSKPSLSYGRGISAGLCPNGPRGSTGCYYDENAWWPCNIVLANCEPGPVVAGVSEASKISLGVSQSNEVRNYTDATGKVYYYLGDPAQSAKVDYKAKTIATSSHCVPMTQLCYFNFDAANTDKQFFNCTAGFSGDIYANQLNKSTTGVTNFPDPNVGLGFSKDPQLTQVGGLEAGYHGIGDLGPNQNWTLPEIYPTNPLYYGAWALGYPPGDPFSNLNFTNDTGIYYQEGDILGGIWMLNCSTNVHEVNYTWINGAVGTFEHRLASTDMSGLLSAPFAMAPYNQYMHNALASIASVAGSGNNSRAIAASFADGFSSSLLAYSVGAMGPVLNEYEQVRNSTINVARIPMIPLYLLLATKAAYVLAVITLAIGAYCFTHPAETEIVKAQLSVRGLAAAHFQQPDLAQQNVVKVLQNRIDIAKGKTPTEESECPTPEKGMHRAAMAPVFGSESVPRDAKVGLLPAADGTWQFVMVANGVWNSIKPIVENLVVTDAAAGGLGTAGEVIAAWK